MQEQTVKKVVGGTVIAQIMYFALLYNHQAFSLSNLVQGSFKEWTMAASNPSSLKNRNSVQGLNK